MAVPNLLHDAETLTPGEKDVNKIITLKNDYDPQLEHTE